MQPISDTLKKDFASVIARTQSGSDGIREHRLSLVVKPIAPHTVNGAAATRSSPSEKVPSLAVEQNSEVDQAKLLQSDIFLAKALHCKRQAMQQRVCDKVHDMSTVWSGRSGAGSTCAFRQSPALWPRGLQEGLSHGQLQSS